MKLQGTQSGGFAGPRHASHVALEGTAQARAAFGGSEALDEGYAVRISFLLGTRDFRAEPAWFAEGEHLYVRVRLEYRDEALATLSASRSPSPPLARANLNVFHPRDASALIDSHPASLP
jgi:predicted hotdog family 3-hydroxylacyl-ACP dehydratase